MDLACFSPSIFIYNEKLMLVDDLTILRKFAGERSQLPDS